MIGDVDIAAVGAALGDERRARMLLALGDGRHLPASMLAAEAGVARSTASEHLARLVDSGLVSVERCGRHRYFSLAGPQVAALLEAAAGLAPASAVRSLRQSSRSEAVRAARTCYDHLAGRLGVALMDALIERDMLTWEPGSGEYRLGSAAGLLGELGVSADRPAGRRPLIRHCIDWSERRPHLAGALGASLAQRMFELDWIRRARHGRAVRVTETGEVGLRESLGVSV